MIRQIGLVKIPVNHDAEAKEAMVKAGWCFFLALVFTILKLLSNRWYPNTLALGFLILAIICIISSLSQSARAVDMLRSSLKNRGLTDVRFVDEQHFTATFSGNPVKGYLEKHDSRHFSVYVELKE